MPVDFDGIDDFITVPDDPSLDITSYMSISLWVYFDTTVGNHCLLHKKGAVWDGNGWYLEAQLDPFTNRTTFVTSGNNIAIGAEPPQNTWVNIIVTFYVPNAAWHARIYIDGVDVTTDNLCSSIVATNEPLTFGSFNETTSFLNGKMSEVAIWSCRLSATEIALLAKSKVKGIPLQIRPASLKGYWPLDDIADGISGDGETFADRSGNGNNGTGDDGGNNSGLTCKAEEVLSYPGDIIYV